MVISTGTKNLQEQLFTKDLPFLKKLFPDARATLMKGRANYLCRQKLYDIERQPVLSGLQEIELYSRASQVGRAHRNRRPRRAPRLAGRERALAALDARRERCTGQKCPQFERCFITLMHQRAAEADVIIVNHHLFFADLALKQGEYASLLPEYAAVVFDEAHDLEDVATVYFGLQFPTTAWRSWRATRKMHCVRRPCGVPEVEAAILELRDARESFFNPFPAARAASPSTTATSSWKETAPPYSAMINALVRLETS